MQHRDELYKKQRDPRRGQAALMMTVALTLVCGAIGLVVDIGWGYFKKQSAQAAAEAAAMAAASWAKSNSLVCGSGGFSCTSTPCASATTGTELYVGCQYATQNGYTDGSGNQHVTLSANTGTPTTASGVSTSVLYVTATVSESIPQTFSRVLGSPSWMTALAQATATVPLGRSKDCIYALGTSGTVLTVSGNGTVATGCNIYVNSNNSDAADVSGSNASVTVTAGGNLIAHGGVQTHGGATVSPAALQNQNAVSDPYAAIQGASYTPTTGSCQPNPTSGTIGPGTYCSQINIGGSNDLTLTTGTYIFQNGINWGSSGTLTGTKVFIYVPAGTVSSSGGTWNLTAGTTGKYAGIAIYQTLANTSADAFSGGASMTGTGVIYAPGASVTFSGGSSFSATSMTLAAQSFTFSGNASMTNGAISTFTGGTPGLVQ